MGFIAALRDRVIGKDVPAVIDVSPNMRAALEFRGQFDPDRLPPYLKPRTANWAEIQSSRLLDTARKSVIVYACLSYLADAVAESPIRVYKRTADDVTEVPDHRARQVLANPNPFMSEAEFLALTIMAMGMQGYAVIEKTRSGAGIPVQLWPLRPDWLYRRLSMDGRKLQEWDYRVPGDDPRIISADDLIVIPYRHDETQERPGVSPLQIAAREIGIDSALTDFLKTFLDAGGIPPFVLEYPDAIPDQATIDQMQEMWAQKYGGSKSFGKLPILHGGYKVAKIGDGINDMAWPDLRAITEDKICQAFRVPRELVQTHSTAAGGSGLTTTEQEGAMSSLQRYGATPLRNRIDGALTRSFLFEFTGGDPTYELAFDVSKVLALQEDEDKRHARVRADYASGLLMLDEGRIGIGRDPLPQGQGQVFAVPFSVTFTRPAELIAPALPPPPKNPPAIPPVVPAKGQRVYRDEKALNPADLELRKNAIAGNRRTQGKLTQVLERKMRGLFADQAERIAGHLAKSQPAYVRSWDRHGVEHKELVDIDWQAEEDALAEILSKFYMTTGEQAAANASSLLGVSVSWDLANPHMNQVITRLGTRIRGIAETTRTDVSQTVADGLSAGKTLPEIADDVRTLIGGDEYRNRALTIARTESQNGYNSASVASYADSGVVDSIEMADNPDHDTDPQPPTNTTCADRDGLTAALSDAQDYIDSAHPNCQLAVLPIVSLGA